MKDMVQFMQTVGDILDLSKSRWIITITPSSKGFGNLENYYSITPQKRDRVEHEETLENTIVRFNVAGYDGKDLTVKLEENEKYSTWFMVISVTGKKEKKELKLTYGLFNQNKYDLDNITATCENGLLSVVFPKKQTTKEIKIEVK